MQTLVPLCRAININIRSTNSRPEISDDLTSPDVARSLMANHTDSPG